MRFDINDYQGRYLMHCKTEDEAKEFCDYLYSIGEKWSDGESYKRSTLWCIYKGNTCYHFNRGIIVRLNKSTKENYIILEWSDFKENKFAKAYLKDGMVVECANGNRYLVLGDKIIADNECLHIEHYNHSLEWTKCNPKKWTINKVYKSNAYYMSEIFYDEFLTLIWERKEEPVEMTIEEICAALGKEIKIVKG